MLLMPLYLRLQTPAHKAKNINSSSNIPGGRQALPEPSGNRSRAYLLAAAKKYARRQNWPAAIRYYSRLIVKFPEPVAQAATYHEHLMDCLENTGRSLFLSPGDRKFIKDLLLSPSKFETQFLLAREMLFQGHKELSHATFSIALASTRIWLAGHPDPYQALRGAWGIAGYACNINRLDLLERYARYILRLVEKTSIAPQRPSRMLQLERVKKQAHLWLLQVHQEK